MKKQTTNFTELVTLEKNELHYKKMQKESNTHEATAANERLGGRSHLVVVDQLTNGGV